MTTTTDIPRLHPAKFTDAVVGTSADALAFWLPHLEIVDVLDPFAGVGRVHDLMGFDVRVRTYGIEIEHEWAQQAPKGDKGSWVAGSTWCADLLHAELPRRSFDAIVVSPCYANRMADHHDAADACRTCRGTRQVGGAECPQCHGTGLSTRNTYKALLQRDPSSGSSAVMQWGDEYRDFHNAAWWHVWQALKPHGLFVLNIKDHIRDGERQRVAAFHLDTLQKLGGYIVDVVTIPARGNRNGANAHLRTYGELVVVLEKTR